MAESENNENLNSQNGAENEGADNDLDLDLESEENKNISEEDKVKKLTETNKRLFERVKKAEGFEKQADGTWVKKQPKPKPEHLQTPKKEIDEDTKKTVASLALAEAKRQFGYANGLSPEETDAVFRINPNPTKETLEDPFVKGGLEAIRAKKRVENNTPGSSSRSPKPFTVKPDASPEERQKAHDEWVANWKPKGQR